ncbi:hypothetical protein MMC31_001198 [Peltigera leucophlebia]|nr:hypothetical protein [Peltigera leucophlebia]
MAINDLENEDKKLDPPRSHIVAMAFMNQVCDSDPLAEDQPHFSVAGAPSARVKQREYPEIRKPAAVSIVAI